MLTAPRTGLTSTRAPSGMAMVARQRGRGQRRRLSGRGELADLVREAPVALVVRHAQLFQAAIRAYEDGRAEAAERFWLQTGTLWSEA